MQGEGIKDTHGEPGVERDVDDIEIEWVAQLLDPPAADLDPRRAGALGRSVDHSEQGESEQPSLTMRTSKHFVRSRCSATDEFGCGSRAGRLWQNRIRDG